MTDKYILGKEYVKNALICAYRKGIEVGSTPKRPSDVEIFNWAKDDFREMVRGDSPYKEIELDFTQEDLDHLADIIWWIKGYIAGAGDAFEDCPFSMEHHESLRRARIMGRQHLMPIKETKQ